MLERESRTAMFAMTQLMISAGSAMWGSMVAAKMMRVRRSPTSSNQNPPVRSISLQPGLRGHSRPAGLTNMATPWPNSAPRGDTVAGGSTDGGTDGDTDGDTKSRASHVSP